MSEAIPITLLTGYLGSGKTTLLNRLLQHPELRDTAVLVNEFGDIALDHELLYSASESIVLLDRGCLCCALRSDLAEQLDDLYTRRLRKEVPAFARVVIETSGLADPAPILQTLVAEPMLAALYRLDAVVTTADAELGLQELDTHFESVKQAAVADRIVLTKADRTGEASIATLETRLRVLNPAAPIVRARHGEVDPALLFDGGLSAGLLDPQRLARWFEVERYRPVPAGATPGWPLQGERHDARVRSFARTYDAPVSGGALWRGLEALIERHGEKLLRVKGIVDIGQERPRVIHIVQHVLYPVLTLPRWPSNDRRTRLVFIVRDLEAAQVFAPLDEALGA